MDGLAELVTAAIFGAMFGAVGAWLVMRRKLASATARMRKYEHMRKQLEQQKLHAMKQIEQLQADLTDLRRDHALRDAPKPRSAPSGPDSVGGAALLASEPYFDSDVGAPEGFAQTQISLIPHSKEA